ncbi:hypothetical protein GCM10017750_68210 [Streptomyces racemochromogenes]
MWWFRSEAGARRRPEPARRGPAPSVRRRVNRTSGTGGYGDAPTGRPRKTPRPLPPDPRTPTVALRRPAVSKCPAYGQGAGWRHA